MTYYKTSGDKIRKDYKEMLKSNKYKEVLKKANEKYSKLLGKHSFVKATKAAISAFKQNLH